MFTTDGTNELEASVSAVSFFLGCGDFWFAREMPFDGEVQLSL